MKTRSNATPTKKTKAPKKQKKTKNPPQKQKIAKAQKPKTSKKPPKKTTKTKDLTAKSRKSSANKGKKQQSINKTQDKHQSIELEPEFPFNTAADPLSQPIPLESGVSKFFEELENQKTFLEPLGEELSAPIPSDFLLEIDNHRSSILSLSSDKPLLRIKTSQFVNERQGTFLNDYKIIKELGSGSFGQVYKVQNLRFPERLYAMKKIRKRSSDDILLIEQEINSLKRLDHPNIMKVMEFYQDDLYYYLILEYCEGQELFDYLISKGTFNEKNACKIMKQLLSSVSHAHKHKIVHRDLKPENIMIQGSDLTIKIIDWGFATIFNTEEVLKDNYGTAFYVAPEVLMKKYNEKCDVWSCGVILYIMLIGSPPITYSTNRLLEAQKMNKNANVEFLRDELICKKLVLGNYDLKIESYFELSPEVKDLLKMMLNRNTALRPSASEALSHRWFSKYDPLANVPVTQNLANTLNNLKNFKADQKLLQAVLAYMAYQGTHQEDEAKMKAVFQELDLNGDGELQREEILMGYKKILKEDEAEIEVDKIMEALDIDHNNSISYTEFILATMNKKKVITEARIKEAFDMFDEDKNGSISLQEIKKVLGGNEENGVLDEESWRKLIAEIDSDNNGEIDFSEFNEMMKNFCSQ